VDQFRQFLQAMDQLIMGTVINATTVVPPSAPSNGDAYLLSSTPSGAWSGQQGTIAVWDTQVTLSGTNTLSPAWVFYTPKVGWVIWNTALGGLYVYNGSTWNAVTSPLPTATAAGQVLTATGAGTTYTAQAPQGMQLIQSITTTVEPSVTFSSIPDTYKNLRLVCNFAISGGDGTALVANFNGDSTSGHYAYGESAQVEGTYQALQSASTTYIRIAPAIGTVAVLDIVRYNAGGIPTLNNFGVSLTGTFIAAGIGADTYSGSLSGTWIDDTVTSITLSEAGGTDNFYAGSTFDLYGY
jgi:hypothetical protein